MQAFYAFSQSNNDDLKKGISEFNHSIKKTYDLYIYLIQIFIPLKRHAGIKIEESKRSFLEKESRSFSESFINNKVIHQIESSKTLNKVVSDLKINWLGDVENDLIKKLFKAVYNTESYNEILNFYRRKF